MKLKSVKTLVVVMIMASLTVCSVYAKSDTGKVSIGKKTFKGVVNGGNGYQEKTYNSYATASSKIDKIRTKLSVAYAKSGTKIGSGEVEGWLKNKSAAYTCDYEMHHFYNKETKKYDGFVNTKCMAYGTADAIHNGKSYVVYTSVKY